MPQYYLGIFCPLQAPWGVVVITVNFCGFNLQSDANDNDEDDDDDDDAGINTDDDDGDNGDSMRVSSHC